MRSEKEMLDYLKQIGDCAHCVDCSRKDVPRCIIIEDAIRAAIVRLGGCTKRAVEIMDDAEKLDHETWEEVVMEFLEDIRDFGEEGK